MINEKRAYSSVDELLADLTAEVDQAFEHPVEPNLELIHRQQQLIKKLKRAVTKLAIRPKDEQDFLFKLLADTVELHDYPWATQVYGIRFFETERDPTYKQRVALYLADRFRGQDTVLWEKIASGDLEVQPLLYNFLELK